MNSPLSPVHCASHFGFFSVNFSGLVYGHCWILPLHCQWASVSFVADTLALICPLCVLCLTISACLNRLKSSFVSSHHFTLTFHNSLNPFHPHPHCVVSSSLQLGLKSLFRLDITTHELKGGNSTVVALYWECPAAGVKTVTIVSYRRSKTSQLWFNLLIVASPRWREDCHYRQ